MPDLESHRLRESSIRACGEEDTPHASVPELPDDLVPSSGRLLQPADERLARGDRCAASSLLLVIAVASNRSPAGVAEAVVDVHDHGLELDDEHGAPARMPGDDIDHPTLAVDRERDLVLGNPIRHPPEEP